MRRTVHLAAGEREASLCGWLFVNCESDASKVTCRACLKLLTSGPVAIADVVATLAPTAGPPPILTPALWGASCRGGEQRCGACDLCEWERSANLWAAVSPWAQRHVLAVAVDAPRWPSVASALSELVEWERAGRTRPSALGGLLRRIELGETGGRSQRRSEGHLGRAGELVAVRQALELAYPSAAHRLPQEVRMALLCVRLGAAVRPTYEELAAELGETEGELKALVRHGRAAVTGSLSARGLVPMPRQRDLRAVRA